MAEYYVKKKGPVAMSQQGPVKHCVVGDPVTIADGNHAQVLLDSGWIGKKAPKVEKPKKSKAKSKAKSEKAPDNKAMSAEEDK